MAVTRKPKDEPILSKFLQKNLALHPPLPEDGSAVKTQQDLPKDIRFTLHVPGALCQELDQLRKARRLKISRHQWVLEAILEKIQRESA